MARTTVELGYEVARDLIETLRDEHADRIAFDEEAFGGLVVVAEGVTDPDRGLPQAGAVLLYLCTDAQAWGTLHAYDDAAEAMADAERIIGELHEQEARLAEEAE